MKVFAHYYDSDETGNNYRWRTLLHFGTSWDIIGSVVMKNPGSAEPHNYVHESTTLKQLERFPEPDYGIYSQWYYFSSDDTMRKVEKLFCAYYNTATLNGVIQVFNLMNVRDPNLEQALIKNNKAIYQFSKTIESDIKSLVAPVYLGWGDLWKKEPFREDAEKIFHVVQEQLNGKYLFPRMADNKFYHPQYLLGTGINTPISQFILNSFCQNTNTPILETPIIPRKHISKKDVFERLVGRLRLRDEFNLKESEKTCRFQITEELTLTITCTGSGYVGIRHTAYAGKYCLGNYSHIEKYRAILSDLGYDITPEVWLGTKDFTEYDGDEEGIVNNILSEIATIKQKIRPISNLY